MSEQDNEEEIKRNAEKYAKLSLHYSDNAQKFIKLKEFEKASEMMWGSMSTILKAVAAKKGTTINNHKNLFVFAKKIAKDIDDSEIYGSFLSASNIHTNFYESDLDEETALELIKRISATIGILMRHVGYRPR